MAEQKLTLAEKMRKAREFTREVTADPIGGGDAKTYKFKLRRPTEVEWFDVVVGTGSSGRFLQFIIGWENVIESDVIKNGDPHPLQFSESVRDEWLADRSDIFTPLITAIFDEFKAHGENRKVAEKN